jgi:hypothetical protein
MRRYFNNTLHTPETLRDGINFLMELQNLSQPSPSVSPNPVHFLGW